MQRLSVTDLTFKSLYENFPPCAPAGLVLPALLIVIFGTYVSHYQGRCSCAERLWEVFCCRRRSRRQVGDYPPDGVIVLSTAPQRKFSFKTRRRPDNMVAVVVMPDKTCQVALSQEALNPSDRSISYFRGEWILFYQKKI